MRRSLIAGTIVALLFLAVWGTGALLIGGGLIPNPTLTATLQFNFDPLGVFRSLGLTAASIALALALLQGWHVRQQQKMRRETQAAEAAARRRFLRRLDHELKNPLTIIRLGITNLRQQLALPPEPLESLDRIAQQTQRLQMLVENLRTLTDLEEQPIDQASVQLPEILDDLVQMARGQGRVVVLTIQQVPWPLSPVSGDPDLLFLVFRNLIENALKFSRPADQIEVRATDDGHTAVVEIADTGPGIPPGDLANVFDELYRGQNVKNTQGSGLGLALVRRIVSLHQGDILVRSREGQGTVMIVRLPLASDQR